MIIGAATLAPQGRYVLYSWVSYSYALHQQTYNSSFVPKFIVFTLVSPVDGFKEKCAGCERCLISFRCEWKSEMYSYLDDRDKTNKLTLPSKLLQLVLRMPELVL